MHSDWLLPLGDWNPQFLRELKGRLTGRSIVAVLAISLLTQGLILLYFQRQLALPSKAITDYCVVTLWTTQQILCQVNAVNQPVVNWQVWWFHIFHTLTWVSFLVLLVMGCYLLVQDIAQEERRGTLNFIRLSPQSSQQILLGKLLGVPILLYLAIVVALPLHLFAAVKSGLSFPALLTVYLLAAIVCGFLHIFSLFYSLGWGAKSQAWYVVVIDVVIYFPLLMLWFWWGYQYQQDLQFGGLANWHSVLQGNAALAGSLVVLGLCGLGMGYPLWHACRNLFHASIPP